MCHIFFHFLLVIAGFYRLSTGFHLIAVDSSPDDPASHNILRKYCDVHVTMLRELCGLFSFRYIPRNTFNFRCVCQ
jgi:hypothetical protein